MMRKYVSRLLALVLVLCMVVLCVPVRAQAEDVTRPEGYTDEQWQEYLRKKKLLEAAAEDVVADETTTITSSTTDTEGVETPVATPPSASEIPEQSVTVDVPVDENETVKDNKVVSDGTLSDGSTTVDATVTEEYTADAKVKEVEITDGQVTDIEYEITLNKTTTATEKKDESDATPPKTAEKTETKVDVAENQAAAANKTPAPQYQVNMSVNDMKDAPTRVEHRYKETDGGDEKVEYYYNADNGVDETDSTKKYFTVSGFEEDETPTAATTLKDKVVSLWTSFLGIFHITNDAFENQKTRETASTLTEAVNDASAGDTVEMLRNYETVSSAALDKNVTVDLNGHKYTSTGDNAAIAVSGDGKNVTVENGSVYSNGDGVQVSGSGNKFSLKNIFLRSNADKDASGNTAAVAVSGSGNTVSIDDSHIDGARSTYGIQDASTSKNTVNIDDSVVEGKTGVALKNTDADISNSRLTGTSGAALAVDGNTKDNDVVITSGRFESGKAAANIYAKDKDDIASITIKGGRFTDPDDLYSYIPRGRALISHNDGSYFLYEVVGTDYTPTRDGYRFLGYTDGNGNAISLAEAYRKGVIAYAQWKEIPEKAAKPLTVNDLIRVKTDETGCTTKVTVKGDTAYVTVKDADGEFAPISEVTVSSVKQLQNLKIDTIEIQVDEDVTLVLDVEKAKENGFTDTIEVTLEKDTLLITSGKDTCIELDIAVLKASDKPVEIQLVEGELSVMLGKNSSLTVDLTKALKTGERIVVKLENGVLKLYDKYNKPIKEN